MHTGSDDSPLEKVAETKFVEYAASKGCIALKMEIRGWRNWPDRIILVPDSDGRVFFIEFKRKGELPRKGQLFRIERLRAMGFTVHLCDTLEQAKEVLHEFLHT